MSEIGYLCWRNSERRQWARHGMRLKLRQWMRQWMRQKKISYYWFNLR